MCRRKATTVASLSSLRTAERGSFGPVLRTSTVSRFRHFATAFGLTPNSLLNSTVEAHCLPRGHLLGLIGAVSFSLMMLKLD